VHSVLPCCCTFWSLPLCFCVLCLTARWSGYCWSMGDFYWPILCICVIGVWVCLHMYHLWNSHSDTDLLHWKPIWYIIDTVWRWFIVVWVGGTWAFDIHYHSARLTRPADAFCDIVLLRHSTFRWVGIPTDVWLPAIYCIWRLTYFILPTVFPFYPMKIYHSHCWLFRHLMTFEGILKAFVLFTWVFCSTLPCSTFTDVVTVMPVFYPTLFPAIILRWCGDGYYGRIPLRCCYRFG